MEERLDPVPIIARPSRAVAEDQEQVFGLWMHVARKAGWQVKPTHEPVNWSAGECGVVDIEGLRYLIRVGDRSRGRAAQAPDGHVGTYVAEAVVQGRTVFFPVFVLTSWAEPIQPEL